MKPPRSPIKEYTASVINNSCAFYILFDYGLTVIYIPSDRLTES